MGPTSHLLKRGIELAKEKRLEDAGRILKLVTLKEQDNWLAWAWYYESHNDDEERIRALENMLRIRPDTAGIQKQLDSLLSKRTTELPKPMPVVSQPVPVISQATPSPARSLGVSCFVVGVFLLFMILLARNVQAAREIRGLTARNQQLSSSYNVLLSAHSGLQNNFDTLQQQNHQLGLDFQSLQSGYSQLQNGYNLLQNDFTTLRTSYDDLTSQYDLLNQQFSSLESKAIVPPYIYIRGRDVWTAFEKTDGQIIYWKTPFDTLEYDLRRGNEIRARLDSERSMIRAGQAQNISADHWLLLTYPDTQEKFYVIDERNFVDSSEFRDVIPQMYAQALDEQAFIHEIWNIVAQLTVYSAEIDDTPRYPLETLLEGGGDCEDTAILFASMILAAPVDWDVYLVYMDLDSPYNPIEMNHVMVYIETDRASYSVETTSKTLMNPYQAQVEGWYYIVYE